MLQPHTKTSYCFHRVSEIFVLGVLRVRFKQPPTKKECITTP
jgi:hypothetical protein